MKIGVFLCRNLFLVGLDARTFHGTHFPRNLAIVAVRDVANTGNRHAHERTIGCRGGLDRRGNSGRRHLQLPAVLDGLDAQHGVLSTNGSHMARDDFVGRRCGLRCGHQRREQCSDYHGRPRENVHANPGAGDLTVVQTAYSKRRGCQLRIPLSIDRYCDILKRLRASTGLLQPNCSLLRRRGPCQRRVKGRVSSPQQL